ncbi:MAG: hypothetical protein OXE99_09545, partial [Cellvibrionales bacterium]|nr:hypothetical protein [Cellvibrionales bacterium]
LTVDVPILFMDAVQRDSRLLNYLEPLTINDMWLETMPRLEKNIVTANHFSIMSMETLRDMLPTIASFFREAS